MAITAVHEIPPSHSTFILQLHTIFRHSFIALLQASAAAGWCVHHDMVEVPFCEGVDFGRRANTSRPSLLW